jgi:hypothetical protein
VEIQITENCTAIDAFGLEVVFDPNVFDYDSTSEGSLTSGWITVDGNETSSGVVTVGGFNTAAIPAGSSGTIAVVRLKVACGSCGNGTTSDIQIRAYSDDILAMTPNPNSATFTYQTLLFSPKITFIP